MNLKYTRRPRKNFTRCCEVIARIGSKDEVIGELYFISPEETKANARLITAAPEMYETLYDAMNTIYNFFDDKVDLYDLQAKANYINTLLFRIDKEKENTQC